MEQIQQTVLYQSHLDAGGKMVDFAGWNMPIQYSDGIVAEHLATRKQAGLFDVSHMGRFQIGGSGAVEFLQRVLTNDCARLAVGQAQYTILANKTGGAIDDAFLYRLQEEVFLLVVNASNKDKDWRHLQEHITGFPEMRLEDVGDAVAMLALQGPQSETIMESLITEGTLPSDARNSVGTVKIADAEVTVARTGYTGEPVCFELFISADSAVLIWNKILEAGGKPVGLGARDTLRMEAGLPLYGHELGTGADGSEIPVFAIGLAAFAVSFDDISRAFIGRAALEKQAQTRQQYKAGDFSDTAAVPKIVRSFKLIDKGIARDGATVYYDGQRVGWVTSGTMVPDWEVDDAGGQALLDRTALSDTHCQRALGLCMIPPQVAVGDEIEVEVRGRKLKAKIVLRNLENRKINTTYAVL